MPGQLWITTMQGMLRVKLREGPPPIQEWISWVDPATTEPDFHVPAAFGWLEIGTGQ